MINIFITENKWGDVPLGKFAGPDDVCDLRGAWRTVRQLEPGVCECPCCGARVDFRAVVAPSHAAAEIFGGNTRAATPLCCDVLWAVWRPVKKKWFAVQKRA
jgi:hypothetical protein